MHSEASDLCSSKLDEGFVYVTVTRLVDIFEEILLYKKMGKNYHSN